MPDGVPGATMRVMRLLLAAATSALVLAAPAVAGPVPASTAGVSVRVAPATVHAGHVITVTGRGWPRNAGVELLIGPPYREASHITWARTTSSGTFTKRVRIWSRMKAGRWVLLGCRRACRIKAAASFRVTR